MQTLPSMSYVTRRAYEAASRTASITLSNMAFQDWVAASFQLFMWLRVEAAPESVDALIARRWMLTLCTITLCTIVLVRGEILPSGRLRALLYRAGIFASVVLSYLALRWLLPSLGPRLLDPELLAIDEMLFPITPSVWMAQFNTPAVVEWFAFFYYSYFWLLGGMLLPSLFFDRGKRQIELLTGALIVAVVGHVSYTFVPGVGPYAYLTFDEPLHGGFFLHLVFSTVNQAGAMLDIFPSLHTAHPTHLAMFAFAYRHEKPFKYVWPIIMLFAVNMVIATLFLRWHWGIDVIAGLCLAFAARRTGILVASREGSRGDDPTDVRQPVWEQLFSRSHAR